MHEGERGSVTNRSQMYVLSRLECRVDFDSLSWLDHLIAVSRILPVWVGQRPLALGRCQTH